MKKINYYVIGGQYEKYCYGGTETLQAAKVLATKHAEYWDNWQGWHTPVIYRADDCETIETTGWITMRDGQKAVVPRYFAEPVAYKTNSGKWELQ